MCGETSTYLDPKIFAIQVSRSMKTSVNRVFLLDFEGTIREAARTLQSRRVTSVTKSDVGELGMGLSLA